MRVVIYARYSSSSQREASIEEQIKVCTEYAERNKYTVIKTYSDSAMTGTNDKRPALQRLFDYKNTIYQKTITKHGDVLNHE